MIVSQAPTRLSLFGGGTDVGEYADLYGGMVLNLAVNLRQKITLYEPRDEKPLKLKRPEGSSPKFYKAFFDAYGLKEMPFDAEFGGEITGGTGSSASAAVAMVGALNKFENYPMSNGEIAEKAWEIECVVAGLFGGKQDQYASALGGCNALEFKNGTVTSQPMPKGFIEWMLPYMMLFHTPNRSNTKIQEGLRKLTPVKKASLDAIKKLMVDGVEAIGLKNIEAVGNVLKASWEAKKNSNNVTTPEVDKLYSKAISLGSYGGKLMGSGGGGYMFFLVEPSKWVDFKKEFCNKDVKWVDFSPSWDGLEVRKI